MIILHSIYIFNTTTCFDLILAAKVWRRKDLFTFAKYRPEVQKLRHITKKICGFIIVRKQMTSANTRRYYKYSRSYYVYWANYTSQSSVSESASEYSADGKVPIGFCGSSYIYQSTSVIFSDIHPHLNITKLYPFYTQIRTSH